MRRSGAILIVALVVTFTLVGMVLMLCQEMRIESVASGNRAATAQAEAIERGAEQYVLGVLTTEGENIADLSDDQFAAIQVGDGYFWILRPQYDDPQMPIFGLMSESGKLNINTASYNQLLLLPEMTEDVADAIIDWRDSDDTSRTNGAENDYYPFLPDPYQAKNAAFESVEELLMVRGMTREYLFGDGTAAPLGQTGSQLQSKTLDTLFTDPQVARGLADILTVYSSDAAGGTRININDRNSRSRLQTLLQEQLSQSRANEIMNLLGDVRRNPVRDVFDFYVRCKLKPEELDKIFGQLSTSATTSNSGRININVAPRSVLLCLSANLTTDDVDKLIAARDSAAPAAGEIGWAVGALGAKAVGLGNLITSHSYQYSADILAVSGNGRSFNRVRIVVNNSSGTPQIVYRRDITDRGWPMDQQILASLRTGQGIGNGGLSGANGGRMSSTLGGTRG